MRTVIDLKIANKFLCASATKLYYILMSKLLKEISSLNMFTKI